MWFMCNDEYIKHIFPDYYYYCYFYLFINYYALKNILILNF